MCLFGKRWVSPAVSMVDFAARLVCQRVAGASQGPALSALQWLYPEDVTIDLTFDGGQTRTDLNNVYSYLKDFELLNSLDASN